MVVRSYILQDVSCQGQECPTRKKRTNNRLNMNPKVEDH